MIDVLINNAAIDSKVSREDMSSDGRLEHFDVENFNREISVGLTGAILCSKHIGTKMNSLSGGKIINIASDLSVISQINGFMRLTELKINCSQRNPFPIVF